MNSVGVDWYQRHQNDSCLLLNTYTDNELTK